ncbi:MAG: gamma carbonic anhydrase family protein [Halothiobacillaceae bacterium]
MIRSFEGKQPSLGADVWVDDSAVVIGDVSMDEGVSVWPQAVLRGDINAIRIGRDSNLQDGVIVHVNHASEFGEPAGCTVGEAVTVGHRATLHACQIGNRCLVGMGAIVLDHAVVEDEVIIGAGTVVSPGKVLESGYLWLGVPARKVRPITDRERAYFDYSAQFYRELAHRHQGET